MQIGQLLRASGGRARGPWRDSGGIFLTKEATNLLQNGKEGLCLILPSERRKKPEMTVSCRLPLSAPTDPSSSCLFRSLSGPVNNSLYFGDIEVYPFSGSFCSDC